MKKLQRGCVIMKTAEVVADPEPAKSVPTAHMMYKRYSSMPRTIPTHRNTYPVVHLDAMLRIIVS